MFCNPAVLYAQSARERCNASKPVGALAGVRKKSPGFLRQSLESLCGQTFSPDEVVLVEDGPLGEDLASVIASFRTRLPIVSVRLPVNKGLGIALSEGLDQCRGEFVARVDGDDISVPDRFEKQLAFLDANPGVDVVGGATAEFDDDRLTPRAIRRLPCSGLGLLRFAKYRNPLNHMTVIFRKAAVLEEGITGLARDSRTTTCGQE